MNVIETCCAVVADNTRVCREHFALELVVPGFSESAPGQFLQIRCSDDDTQVHGEIESHRDGPPAANVAALCEDGAFLPRPMSIADRWSDASGGVHLLIIHRAIGPGTRWLANLRPGQSVDFTGPLGVGFRIPEAATDHVLVGGGIGVPPLLYLARVLLDSERSPLTAIFGARSREWLPLNVTGEPETEARPSDCVKFPDGRRPPTIITSDDGTIGMPGTVADALKRRYGDARNADRRVMVYACGPEPMLGAVAGLTRELGIDCQLCIERMMGCGLGTCLSCVVRLRDPGSEKGWRYGLTCQEGPVFDRDELAD